MRNQRGVTLVEALVAGIIGAVVMVALAMVVSYYGQSSAKGVAISLMQMRTEAFMQQFALDVRKASAITLVSTSEIQLDSAYSEGTVIGYVGWKLNNGTMTRYHRVTTGGSQTYSAFPDANSPAMFSSGQFSLSGSVVSTSFTATMTYKGTTYTDVKKGGSYRCRNK